MAERPSGKQRWPEAFGGRHLRITGRPQRGMLNTLGGHGEDDID
jgi:hypothetical protein